MISKTTYNLVNILLITFGIYQINGFSYNVKSKIVFSPEQSNNRSYFGYTTLLRKNNDKAMILVGAPRETSVYKGHSDIDEPGVMYTCDINLAKTYDNLCTHFIYDSSANTRKIYPNGKSYHHRKDNMWLGMSLEGTVNKDGVAVVCAPRWINQYNYDKYNLNGMCYIIRSVKNNTASPQMLIPLLDSNKQMLNIDYYYNSSPYGQYVYYYSYGQAGMSVKLSEDATELLIGAPGVYIWSGTVIKYKITHYRSDIRISLQSIPNPYYNSDLKTSSYFGYNVGYGNFNISSPTLYIASAPRGANCKGEVIIFDFPIRENNKIKMHVKLEGKQMGEYFGYTFATLDINKDNLTDLIVSAPMHGMKTTSDVGRVYVYINHNMNFIEQDAIISGTQSKGARFGSTIAEIGDINDDGFNDVAIGAPYEDNGKGAIYIYLGSELGLNPNYVQRISLEDMRGFGISISKAVDIDDNGCNDLVVGAHESEKVILFRCHPSTNINATLKVVPTELLMTDTELTAYFCINLKGTRFPTEIELKVKADSEYRRITFKNESDSTFSISGLPNVDYCKTISFAIKNKTIDYSTSVDIEIGFELKSNPMNEESFCHDCPVISPMSKKVIKTSIPFASGCGTDLVCSPDLKVTLSLLSEVPFIIGKTSNLSVNLILENTGEPAFLAKTELEIQPNILLLRVPSQCILEKATLICNFDNPLPSHAMRSIIVEFDTSLLRQGDTYMYLKVRASSSGTEMDSLDNTFVLKTKLESDIKFKINSDFGEFEYVSVASKDNITIVHSYEILNEGYTTTDDIKVVLFLPVKLDKEINILKVPEPTVTLNQETLICLPLNGAFYQPAISFNQTTASYTTDNPTTETIEFPSTESNPLSKNVSSVIGYIVRHVLMHNLIENMNNDGSSPIDAYHINCTNEENVTCLVILCSGRDFKPGRIQISIPMLVSTTNIDKILNQESAIALSSYAMKINNTSTMISSARTILIHTIPVPTPIWLYIVGVSVGIVTLAILIAVFNKFGFFNRQNKENLELLKSQEVELLKNQEEH